MIKKTIVASIIFFVVAVLEVGFSITPTAMNKIPAFAYNNYVDLLPRDGTDDNFAVSGVNTTLAYDTGELSPWDGLQTVKFHTDAGVTSTGIITFDGAATKQLGSHIGLVCKINDASNAINKWWFRVQLGNAYYRFILTKRATYFGLVDNEWRVLWFSREFVEGTGSTPTAWCTTETNQEFTFDRFYLQGNTPTADMDIWIGGILSYTPEKGIIIFRFDDIKESVYDYAFPRMKARKWRGCVAAISDNVGTAGVMTLAELQDLYANYWDIMNHTSDHSAGGVGVDPDDYLAKVSICKKYLCDNGMPRAADVFIPPGNSVILSDSVGGDHLEKYVRVGSAAEYKAAYGNDALDGEFFNEHTGSIIPPDWTNLQFFSLHGTSQTDYTAAAQAFVQSIVNERSVGIVYTHQILPGTPGAGNISEGFFDAMVADVSAKEAAGLIEVLTFTDWKNRIDSDDPTRRKAKLPRTRMRYDETQYYK